MGKSLIIKGADFSQNALNVTTWLYEGNDSRRCWWGPGNVAMQNNNFWGNGPKLSTALSNINYARIILSLDIGSYEQPLNINIGKNYVLIKLKIDSEASLDNVIATFSVTSEDIIRGYKDFTFSPVNLDVDETIAYGIFDKQNQSLVATDNTYYLPFATNSTSAPSGSRVINVGGSSNIAVENSSDLQSPVWLGVRE